jgi:hypothetical protein
MKYSMWGGIRFEFPTLRLFDSKKLRWGLSSRLVKIRHWVCRDIEVAGLVLA